MRFLVYLFPTMMDIMLSTVMFVVAVRLSESGASALTVVASGSVWAIVYSLCSQISGRIVTPRNAALTLCLASLLACINAIGMIMFPGLKLQFFWIGSMGVATAFFFIPFMVFMKDMEEGHGVGVAKASALYTFAWSIGMASGPFISGFIWNAFSADTGWKYCYLMNIILSLIIAVGIWPIRRIVKNMKKKKPENTKFDNKYANMPDLAWMGWLGAVGCMTSVAVVRTLFPYQAALLNIAKIHQGIVLGLMSYVQAFTALFLLLSRYWMYRAFPVALLGISGVTGLLIFGLGTSINLFYIASIVFGIYTGTFSCYLVFHSLVHPEKSAKYLAINETIVGVTGVASPIIAGLLVGSSNVGVPYLACAALVLIIVIVKIVIMHSMRIKIT